MRRKRQKFTWLPVLGSSIETDAGSWRPCFNRLAIRPTLDAGEEPSTTNAAMEIIAVTPDFTPEVGTAGEEDLTLRDFTEGQEYILKRIVGKVFVGCSSTTPTSGMSDWPSVIVKCGFAVARAADFDQTITSLPDEDIDVLAANNVQDPWIWQRTWQLGAANVDFDSQAQNAVWPTNNALYAGGLQTGPHIDSKVARRITREHRLWFVASCVGFDHGGLLVTQQGTQVDIVLDVRYLGAMRRAKNVSSF